VIPTLSRQVIRQQTNTPLDAPVIVWAGNLTDEKRIDRLLRATAVVRQSLTGLHAWIVGTGPLRTALETQARRSSLEHCVRFLGSQDQVANYMNAGDLVALTSDTEGMPAVLLEPIAGIPPGYECRWRPEAY
jgi:glycosyltransferase involved in cell wall biosynthesis